MAGLVFSLFPEKSQFRTQIKHNILKQKTLTFPAACTASCARLKLRREVVFRFETNELRSPFTFRVPQVSTKSEEGFLLSEIVTMHSVAVKKKPSYLSSKPQIEGKLEALGIDIGDDNYGEVVKARSNKNILEFPDEMELFMSCNGIELGVGSGLPPNRCVLDANGKPLEDLVTAIGGGVIITIKTKYDVDTVISAARSVKMRAKVLLPIISHVDPAQADILDSINKIRGRGFQFDYLFISGGAEIDYYHSTASVATPTATVGELIDSVRDIIQSENFKLIIEAAGDVTGNSFPLPDQVEEGNFSGHHAMV